MKKYSRVQTTWGSCFYLGTRLVSGAGLPLWDHWMSVAWAVPAPGLAAVNRDSSSLNTWRKSGGNLLAPSPSLASPVAERGLWKLKESLSFKLHHT